MEVADTEREASYEAALPVAEGPGLRGVELVTSDDHRGLVAAIGRQFQGAGWQRCQVHVARNLRAPGAAEQAARVDRRPARHLRRQHPDPSHDDRHGDRRALAADHPKLARFLEEELESSLTCLAFPAEHRVRIRTTNGVERLNQELKRRTRVVRIFPNRASLLRLVTALVIEQSEEWMSGRRYLDMTLRATSAEGRAVTPLAAAAD